MNRLWEDGLVVSVPACHAIYYGFAPWLSPTKDLGTNCLPAWHASIRVGNWQCSPTL